MLSVRFPQKMKLCLELMGFRYTSILLPNEKRNIHLNIHTCLMITAHATHENFVGKAAAENI